MSEKSLLDDIFGKTEEEVETFMDALKGQTNVPDWAEDRAIPIQQPELTDQISGEIRIQHGFHGSDYVFHVSCNPKKNWKASLDRVVYATAQVMNNVIPQTVEVRIWLPHAEWDIKEITFKAYNLKDEWAVNQKRLNELVIKLFETLNALV